MALSPAMWRYPLLAELDTDARQLPRASLHKAGPVSFSRGLADLSADFTINAAGVRGDMKLNARDMLFNLSRFNADDAFSRIVRMVLSRTRSLRIRSDLHYVG